MTNAPIKIKYALLAFFYVFIASFSFLKQRISAEVCGKIDAGPTYVHIDVLESGKTIKRIDMGAIKGDSSILVWKGLCLKPFFLYGCQGNSQVFSGGLGIGHYTPLNKKLSVTPSFGAVYTDFKTVIHLSPIPDLRLHLKERFRSIAPYLSFEASYCFLPGWRLVALYQYAWSRTRTTIKNLGSDKSHSYGPNYGLMIEHDFNANWSISLGGAYNISLTKEKHGLRAYGARIGIAYWF
jgi:hypothetical protein